MATVNFTCTSVDVCCTSNAMGVVHKHSCFFFFPTSFLSSNIQLTESSLTSLKEENKSLTTKVGEPEGTVKKLNQDLEEEREKERQRSELKDSVTSRWPVYLSLLEQIRYVF